MEMVKMVHPSLGDRVIDVPDSAVQHLIMSGWQRADNQEAQELIKSLEERLALEKSALREKPDVSLNKKEVLSSSTEDKAKRTVKPSTKEEG